MGKFVKEKFKEWAKRYVPAEVLAVIGALIGATLIYFLTNNRIFAAYGGAIGENIGYYSLIISKDIRRSVEMHRNKKLKYGVKSFLKDLRNILVEFGFSETLDSFIIRPFAMYIFPIILGSYSLGIIIGKFVADITFYMPTIIFYEFRKKYFN